MSAVAAQFPPSAPLIATQARAILDKYCVTCHNEKLKTANLLLDKTGATNPSQAAATWEKVIRKLRTGAMPPAGAPRPDNATYASLATYLESALDTAAAANPNAGRPAIHRLNRVEYANSIRDLLDLEIDGASFLPSDDSGYGFDNIADVLSVSPSLMERYLSSARKISRMAVGSPMARPDFKRYEIANFTAQGDRMSDDLPLGSRGGLAARHYFPLDGEYLIKVRLRRNGENIIGIAQPRQIDVRLDGARVALLTVAAKPKANPEDVGGDEDSGLEVRVPVKAGARLLGVALMNEFADFEGVRRPGAGSNLAAVDSVMVEGPYNASGPGDTPSRRKIFVCRPTSGNDEEVCARKILSTLARRAYRRPVADEDIADLLGIFITARKKGSFDTGIETALREILVTPEFLFRYESDPPNVVPGKAYAIGDLDLASRLSYFIWSSMPDDELLNLAERGKLGQREVLEQQVRRMLKDSRSSALVNNFAGQWLMLRNIKLVQPDRGQFPEFDGNLREALLKEAELFFESMLREDRSVLDLLNADYTFVNERLARHYGIPNIYGSQFRRIRLADENRRGLLGKGSVLTVTSYAGRTSPVVRGKWLLENIVGAPPPPPPPNVPTLKEDKQTTNLSMRQRMEQHRANAVCASCHARMDPLGFALENFDAIGKWRATNADKTPIDASGVLPDGTKFQGPMGLGTVLLSKPEQFVVTVTEKLLTYALGRGIEYYDAPAVRSIVQQAAVTGNPTLRPYRWSSLILAIVNSTPFKMRMPAESTAKIAVQR